MMNLNNLFVNRTVTEEDLRPSGSYEHEHFVIQTFEIPEEKYGELLVTKGYVMNAKAVVYDKSDPVRIYSCITLFFFLSLRI
jgi:NADPH-dependent curcumin reductase CurA